jgi:hypothetical protein
MEYGSGKGDGFALDAGARFTVNVVNHDTGLQTFTESRFARLYEHFGNVDSRAANLGADVSRHRCRAGARERTHDAQTSAIGQLRLLADYDGSARIVRGGRSRALDALPDSRARPR